ncbi:D-inositol-3-phosphate glycosyltransferase [Emticicia aquatica]|uniref:D-inositol-3-phosphate glycosyltransferase n=1 Tax=Emticicia aquatica TaxID=1681835 RepID=A0ABN8EY49_9BACT|nr:glycosyltransferase family 1 protein [Emticicia aquatica]CAH0995992.1 D-inositol-3-phosphate glycosyltransferase [Emticicia aquatica]
MKIGIEAQRLFRPHKHGMDIVALELIRSLQKIDTENDYFIFVKSDEDNTCLSETSNFRIIEVPGKNYVFWEQIMLPIYAKKYGVDVLHCTSNTAPMFLSMPLVLTLHDVIFMEQSKGKNTSSNYQKFGNMYRKWLVPKIIRKCKHVVTISAVEKANIVKVLGLPSDDITVVHNGVSGRFGVKPSPETINEVRKQLNLDDDFFLFLGNVEPRKNVNNTVKAFVAFASTDDKVKLVITGLKSSFVEEILNEIGKISFLNRFVFAGFVSENVLLTLYSEAKVFLYPSLREGFGLPILEAMAFGTPVVTSNISAMPEVAGDAAFLVNPYAVDEIATTMKTAYENQELRKEKISSGYLRPSMFTWEKTAEKMLKIYQKK